MTSDYRFRRRLVAAVSTACVAIAALPALASASAAPGRIAAGNDHSCFAALADGVATCWGYNAFGQAGNGDIFDPLDPVSVRTDSRATVLAAGARHTCMIVDDDNSTVSCWGADRYGQLGDGVAPQWDVRTPVGIKGLSGAVKLALGYDFSCALTQDLSVSCWGQNAYGQLGRGDDGTDSDANPEPVGVGGLNQPVDVSAGNGHACAVVRFGIVNCWGRGDYGQLGNGATEDSSVPVQVLTFDGTATARRATQISVADAYGCVVTAANAVRCWGKNDDGELGVSPSSLDSSPTPVTVPMPSGTGTIRMISAGNHSVCVVADPGSQVLCWGGNDSGQLGDGTTTARTTPRLISGIGSVVDISSGGDHTCARSVVSGAETVYCWGDNSYGQIGAGLSGDVASSFNHPLDSSDPFNPVPWTHQPDLPPPPPVFTVSPATSWVNSSVQVFSFSALAGAQCRVDKGTAGACGAQSAGGTYTVSYSNLADGQHTLTVEHTGANGRKSSRRTDWKIDRTPPSLKSNATGAKTVVGSVTRYDLEFAQDASGVVQVEFSNASKAPKTSALPVAANVVTLRKLVPVCNDTGCWAKALSVVSPVRSPKWIRIKDRAGNWSTDTSRTGAAGKWSQG